MTVDSAAFAFGFSFMQLVLMRAVQACPGMSPSVNSIYALGAEGHRIQARRMLEYLALPFDMDTILLEGDWERKRQQAEFISQLLAGAHSQRAMWCFRLGCDLSALSSARFQGLSSAQVNAFSEKLSSESEECGVPFETLREFIWAAADTTLSAPKFMGVVTDLVGRVTELLGSQDAT
jgi:hypothetical protein